MNQALVNKCWLTRIWWTMVWLTRRLRASVWWTRSTSHHLHAFHNILVNWILVLESWFRFGRPYRGTARVSSETSSSLNNGSMFHQTAYHRRHYHHRAFVCRDVRHSSLHSSNHPHHSQSSAWYHQNHHEHITRAS